MPTEAQVIDALRPVEDPEIHRSIVDLGMVRGIGFDGRPGHGHHRAHRRRLPAAQRDHQPGQRCGRGARGRQRRRARLHRHDRRGAPGARADGCGPMVAAAVPTGSAPKRVNPFTDSRTRVLAIASGKGGVGKSSVTTNLAVALAQEGQKVAAVDADVWGFSMPRMLGIDRPPVVIDDLIVPPEANGVTLDLDGFLRPRRPTGRVAGPDAAQGARAVPHRRALGRARLPRRRHASGHRRHRALDGAVPPPRRGHHRHDPAARRAAGRAACRLHGEAGEPLGRSA